MGCGGRAWMAQWCVHCTPLASRTRPVFARPPRLVARGNQGERRTWRARATADASDRGDGAQRGAGDGALPPRARTPAPARVVRAGQVKGVNPVAANAPKVDGAVRKGREKPPKKRLAGRPGLGPSIDRELPAMRTKKPRNRGRKDVGADGSEPVAAGDGRRQGRATGAAPGSRAAKVLPKGGGRETSGESAEKGALGVVNPANFELRGPPESYSAPAAKRLRTRLLAKRLALGALLSEDGGPEDASVRVARALGIADRARPVPPRRARVPGARPGPRKGQAKSLEHKLAIKRSVMAYFEEQRLAKELQRRQRDVAEWQGTERDPKSSEWDELVAEGAMVELVAIKREIMTWLDAYAARHGKRPPLSLVADINPGIYRKFVRMMRLTDYVRAKGTAAD